MSPICCVIASGQQQRLIGTDSKKNQKKKQKQRHKPTKKKKKDKNTKSWKSICKSIDNIWTLQAHLVLPGASAAVLVHVDKLTSTLTVHVEVTFPPTFSMASMDLYHSWAVQTKRVVVKTDRILSAVHVCIPMLRNFLQSGINVYQSLVTQTQWISI